jgi:hypothetical protein
VSPNASDAADRAELAAEFAAKAEALRLSGNPRAAVATCEAGLADAPASERGRIALALALLDLGDLGRARAELAMALAMSPTPRAAAVAPAFHAPADAALDAALEEDELESAFAQAETNPDEMLDANRVVEKTLRDVEQDASEPDFDVAAHPAYATETMASLLDRQGRRSEADTLRQSLARRASPGAGDGHALARAVPAGAGVGPDHARQLRIVSTLESWLHNLKRNADPDARTHRGSGRPRLQDGAASTARAAVEGARGAGRVERAGSARAERAR